MCMDLQHAGPLENPQHCFRSIFQWFVTRAVQQNVGVRVSRVDHERVLGMISRNRFAKVNRAVGECLIRRRLICDCDSMAKINDPIGSDPLMQHIARHTSRAGRWGPRYFAASTRHDFSIGSNPTHLDAGILICCGHTITI